MPQLLGASRAAQRGLSGGAGCVDGDEPRRVRVGHGHRPPLRAGGGARGVPAAGVRGDGDSAPTLHQFVSEGRVIIVLKINSSAIYSLSRSV